MKTIGVIAMLASLLFTAPALAVPLDGYFIASQSCPAFQSFNTQTNPGDIMVMPGRAYEIIEANRAVGATHYRLIVQGVTPRERWVAVDCGIRTVTADGHEPGGGVHAGPPLGWYLLAASWQPGFCETKAGWPDGESQKPECATQAATRFDATHFALHGLWPQPESNQYCGYEELREELERKPWDQLEVVVLTAPTRAALDEAMPGTQSKLERHEWIAHGTCYKAPMEEYFAESVAVLAGLNAAGIDELLVGKFGQQVTITDIRKAFDTAFGQGTGAHVGVVCKKEAEGGRWLLTELRIQLQGDITPTSDFGALLRASTHQGVNDCNGPMVIDPAGLWQGP